MHAAPSAGSDGFSFPFPRRHDKAKRGTEVAPQFRDSGRLGCAGAQCSLYTAISLGFERSLVA
jgi:hypothetical protein